MGTVDKLSDLRTRLEQAKQARRLDDVVSVAEELFAFASDVLNGAEGEAALRYHMGRFVQSSEDSAAFMKDVAEGRIETAPTAPYQGLVNVFGQPAMDRLPLPTKVELEKAGCFDESIPLHLRVDLAAPIVIAEMKGDIMHELLDLAAAAGELGIAASTLRQHVRLKRETPAAVPVIRLGPSPGKFFIRRQALQTWAESHYHPRSRSHS